MRVLIQGAGIGGPTLAYWLRRIGAEVTLVERSPAPRAGGYLVDFWGAGFDVAERMGIAPELMRRGYVLTEMREVAADGHRVAAIHPEDLIGVAGGRYVTIARSDLAAVILGTLDDGVEQVYGDTIADMNERGDAVEVRLASGGTREVDLVIGADGQHSHVRRLVFGPDAEYERDLGIAVCAFDLESYPHRDVDVAVGHTEVGFQAVRLALRDGGTMFLLTFRHEGPIPVDDPEAPCDIVRRALAGAGGEVPGILERMPEARTFYFDKALQIRMPAWTHERVALVGDAGAAPSLLAGQGSALAMVEAYTLAAELDRTGGDHIRAFEAYERRLRPLILSKQDAATGLGVAFAPRSRMQLAVRNAIMKTMAVPFIARLAMGRSLRDQVELPPPAGG